MKYSAEVKRKAVERELKYRRYVYPKRVAEGRMTHESADEEIRIFEAILGDYFEMEKTERLL